MIRLRMRSSRGFTLVETLVALTIAAGSITAYYRAVAQGLDLKVRGDQRVEAAAVAAHVLDDLGVGIQLVPERHEGRAGVYSWSLEITEQSTIATALGQLATPGGGLLAVSVIVIGPAGQPFRLDTVRTSPRILR